MIDHLLKVEALLALDANRDLADLHRRDRAIGIMLGHSVGHAPEPNTRVLGWAVEREKAVDQQLPSSRGAEASARLALLVLGAALGMLAASGVLYYDGAGRVNVLAVLALLVGLPGVTLAASGVLMLPPGARSALTGLGAVQSALEALSPGRLLPLLTRFAPRSTRSAVQQLVAHTRADQRVYGRLRRWLALAGAQIVGGGFNLGVLAAYFSAVVFTDLAFGWSTTLDVESESIHRLTSAISAPWAGWLEAAAPSRELIEASRYFRADPVTPADAGALGQWWPFVAMCLICYAAVPRLALVAIAAWRTRAAFAWTVTHLPGVAELLYRLDTDPVETQADTPEASDERTHRHAPGGRPATSAHGPCSAVIWGYPILNHRAAAEALTQAAGFTPARMLHAGAGSLEGDDAIVHDAAANPEPIVLLVKSWEPPLGELMDFLAALRAAVGPARPIGAVLLATQTLVAPAAGDIDTWRARLASVGDPWLTVYHLPA